jgi:phosphoribosylformylglycinamidine synthase
MVKARIYVTYKEGVLEPQGLAVQGVLGALGYGEVKQVRVGKYIEVELDGPPNGAPSGDNLQERLQEMCDKVLANPVIEDFRFDLSDQD